MKTITILSAILFLSFSSNSVEFSSKYMIQLTKNDLLADKIELVCQDFNDGQKFSITLDYPPMTRSNFAPIKAFIMKQRARLNTFTVIPPVISNAQGVATGTISVNGAISSGATTCTIDGMATSTNDILKAGDYFRFTGQDKVYMAVEDLDSDGSGEGTLTFEPPLRSDVADDVA